MMTELSLEEIDELTKPLPSQQKPTKQWYGQHKTAIKEATNRRDRIVTLDGIQFVIFYKKDGFKILPLYGYEPSCRFDWNW